MTDIKGLIKYDSTDIRVCIFYEFLEGKSVFEAYRSVCKTMGDDVIEYVDFEFWFYRFAGGNFDMDYDRSMDPKWRIITEMPIHIIENVVDRLSWIEQRQLRRVSRSFRDFIDEKDIGYKSVCIDFEDDHTSKTVKLTLDDRTIRYSDRGVCYERDYYDDKREKMKYERHSGLIDKEDIFTTPLYDLTSVLMIPGLQLDTLKVDIRIKWSFRRDLTKIRKDAIDKIFKTMTELLKIVKHKIHVKKLEIKVENEDHVMAILPLLEPGTLEEIDLEYANKRTDQQTRRSKDRNIAYKNEKLIIYIEMNRIIQLDQWKQAKILKMKKLQVPLRNIGHFLHFNHFEILFYENIYIIPADLLPLRNAILTSTSSNFQSCHLNFSPSDKRPPPKIRFGGPQPAMIERPRSLDFVGIEKQLGQQPYPFPGTNKKFLTLKVGVNYIIFQKVDG